jgi:hypothetical protein
MPGTELVVVPESHDHALAQRSGWQEAGPQHLPFGDLHSQTASELTVDMTRRNIRGAKTHVEDRERWRGSSLAMTRVLQMTRTKGPAHR